MFSFENEKVRDCVIESVGRYEKHFKSDFPLQEYLNTTNGIVKNGNAEQLDLLINRSIKTNKPVEMPRDFTQRLY